MNLLFPLCRIMISALRYLLGYDQAVEEEDEDDSGSDDEEEASKPGGAAAVSREAVYKVLALFSYVRFS